MAKSSLQMLQIRPMAADDWSAVRAIYLEGVATGDATFESSAPEWEQWDRSHVASCRLAALLDGVIAGWAALSPVSSRRVYAGVGEVSVYVAGRARGKGVGSSLLEALVTESEAQGFWTLQAGIFPENVASVRLHERAGFRIVGKRSRVGCMNGRWRDVLLMERRSATVGI